MMEGFHFNWLTACSPDKHDIRLCHMLGDINGEEEVLPACLLHHFLQPRLVDGQLATVPSLDAVLINVHNHDLNLRAIEGDLQ
jgi:hypothetical protein